MTPAHKSLLAALESVPPTPQHLVKPICSLRIEISLQ